MREMRVRFWTLGSFGETGFAALRMVMGTVELKTCVGIGTAEPVSVAMISGSVVSTASGSLFVGDTDDVDTDARLSDVTVTYANALGMGSVSSIVIEGVSKLVLMESVRVFTPSLDTVSVAWTVTAVRTPDTIVVYTEVATVRASVGNDTTCSD